MTSLFQAALKGQNNDRPPIWMMRQAGRYHAHYQGMKQKHTFLELCKNPELACEVTMGPINSFDFDAAILFSDILFPLEVLSVPLDFAPGPKLGFLLQDKNDLSRYSADPDISRLTFQADALRLIRETLPRDKGLIGFVGGLLTLYVFAVHGTHKTDLTSARNGFDDGRFDGLMQRLLPLMLENMVLQSSNNIDALAIFESCAGDFAVDIIATRYMPYLRQLLTAFHARCPDIPVIYYAKDSGAPYWQLLRDLPITVLGIDHHQDLTACMHDYSDRFIVQGNFDPQHLTLEPSACTELARAFFTKAYDMPPAQLQRWVCGTGHGLVPAVREENVINFIRMARDMWAART